MGIDENGVQHITATDPVTDENDAHLLACEECQRAFPSAHWLAANARNNQ